MLQMVSPTETENISVAKDERKRGNGVGWSYRQNIWGVLITVVNFINHPNSLPVNFEQMDFMACDTPKTIEQVNMILFCGPSS